MLKRAEILLAVILIISACSVHAETERINREFIMKEGKAAQINLDVDAGEVIVNRGDSGSRVFIEVEYSGDDFSCDIDYDESDNRIEISLDKDGWFGGDDCRAVIELSLPYEIEILLDTELKAGSIEMELGGLNIREFSLENTAGEVEVSFSEPNRSRMDLLEIDTSVGETELLRLGNSRFKRAEINSDIGELSLDFSGEPLAGAEAEIDLDVGETDIDLPGNTGIRIELAGGSGFLKEVSMDSAFYKKGDYYFNRQFEDEKNGFVIRLSHGIGELTLNQR